MDGHGFQRDGIENRRDRRKVVTGAERKEGPRAHEECEQRPSDGWEGLAHKFILNLTVSRRPLGAFDCCD